MKKLFKYISLCFKKKRINKSILVFTLHRSGSMFLNNIIHELCKKSGIIHHSPNTGDLFFPETNEVLSEQFWKDKSGCFGPIRWYLNLRNINEYDVILHLRVPRDVLVSMFFSFCYSHGGEIEGNTGYRKEIRDKGIDDFVLNLTSDTPQIRRYGTGQPDLMGNILERYEYYVSNLIDKPNVTFVKYEEMVIDFKGWLNKVITPFNISNKDRVVEKLFKKYDNTFDVSEENIWGHKRRVIPGDYKEKLKPETVEILNKRFKRILDKLRCSA